MDTPEEMSEEEFSALLGASSLGAPHVKAIRAAGRNQMPPWVRLSFELALTEGLTLDQLAALNWADALDGPPTPDADEQER
ncbi:hypothetical protein [Streptomyces sp. NPDC057302]|uniref:hypothetical protein n=1 Tax=Streptomyces sp. NPDC057302 TaxID=3346094 RepID=UPI00363FD205